MKTVGHVIGILLIHVLGVLCHLPLLRRNRSKRDRRTFYCLVVLSAVYACFLAIAPDRLPTPTDLINKAVMGFALRFFEAE